MLKHVSIVAILFFISSTAWSLSNAKSLQLGTAYAQQGYAKKAIPLLKKSLRDKNLDKAMRATGYYSLGLSYAQLDRDKETVQALEKSLALDDKRLKAYLLLGMTHDLAQRPEQALLVYRRGIKALPGQGQILRELASTELMLGHNKDGIKHLRQAIQRDPDLPELRADLGYALLRDGQFEASIDSLTEALSMGPANADLLTHLADACAGAHKPRLAIDHYRHALELNPKKTRARYHLGLLLKQQGQNAAAMNAFRQVLRRDNKHQGAKIALASILAQTQGKDRKEAKVILHQVLQQDPSYSTAYLGLAQIALAEGQPDEAQKYVQAGLARDKKNPKLIDMLKSIKQNASTKPQ